MSDPHGSLRLCITLPHTRLEDVLEDQRLQQAWHGPARDHLCVELRLDRMPSATPEQLRVALETLGPHRVVVTCRAPEQGGGLCHQPHRSVAQRWALWRRAIASGAGFVDIERTVLAQGRPQISSSATRWLVSHHTSERPDAHLFRLWRKEAQDLGADVVKLVGRAAHLSDVEILQMLACESGWQKPCIALASGEAGIASRILVGRGRHRPPLTYVALDSERRVEPEHVPWTVAWRDFRAHTITPSTPIFGVIGAPIAHSRSPELHNATLVSHGHVGIYLPPLLLEGDPNAFLQRAPESLGLKGLSVTLPHKLSVLQSCDRLDPAAAQAGAANTLWAPHRTPQGWRWRGDNTDGTAAVVSLKEALGRPLSSLRIVVLGAGGAARSVCAALKSQEAHVVLWARRPKQASALALALGVDAVCDETLEKALRDADVVVHCTPVGMTPADAHSLLDNDQLAILPADACVFDTVYTPEVTVLLKQAQRRGLKILGGLDMLRRQGDLQAQAFYGLPNLIR